MLKSCVGRGGLVAAVLVSVAAGHALAVDITLNPGDSIDAAVVGASDGDRILLNPGTYAGDVDYRGKLLTIEGIAGAGATTIQGSGAGPVIRVRNQGPDGAALRGVTVTGGSASRGGGIDVASAAHLLIEDCVVSGNAASSSGGGLACRGATAALENVIFSANTAGSGADVFVQNEGDFTATGCDFTTPPTVPTASGIVMRPTRCPRHPPTQGHRWCAVASSGLC